MMPPRSRLVLLAATTVVVVAFTAAVIIDGPTGHPRAPAVPSSSASPTSTPSASGFDGAALPAQVRARDFTLVDQAGRRVSLSEYRGRVVVLAFLYSSCGSPCVLIAQQIRGALDELPQPVPVLIVSVDPQRDTPASVQRFLAGVSLTGRVHYLTGPVSELRPVWHSYGATPANPSISASARRAQSENSTGVLLVDGRGFERVLFPLEELTPEALAHDIRRLQSNP